MNISESEKRTVTDKLVEQAFRQFSQRLELEYEKCIAPAGAAWFEQLDRVETRLQEVLSVRPLAKHDIRVTTDRAFRALQKSLREERTRQPKLRQAVRITTGEVWYFIDE